MPPHSNPESNLGKKVLILYSKFGGGHYNSAKALRYEITLAYPSCQVELRNYTDCWPKKIQKLSESLYSWLTSRKLKKLWGFLYWLGLSKISLHFIKLLYQLEYSKFKNFLNLEKTKYDFIFSTYYTSPHLTKLQREFDIPTATMITDPFSLHPIWTLNKDHRFLVFSDQAHKLAQKYGVKAQNLIQINPSLDLDRFQKPKTYKKNTKPKLNKATKKTKILVTGGGCGLSYSDKIMQILSKNRAWELTIVCGYNQNLKTKLEKQKKSFNIKQVEILGYVNLPNLIQTHDIIISKAGPATIFEILYYQKPMIIVDYIWGQELGNLNFVIQNQLGLYNPNLRQLPQSIKQILNQQEFKKTNKSKIIFNQNQTKLKKLLKF